MKKKNKYSKEEIFKANIDIHTAVASEYNNEPHFRPENIARVTRIISSIREKTNGKRLLDVGCGTGFIINIAKNYFREIIGIDLTPSMIRQIDLASDKSTIKVAIANSEAIPCPDNYFDVVTANAFLHHLPDLKQTLKEIRRVLRPGGIFYSDLDPNAYFWDAIVDLPPHKKYTQVVAREIEAVLHKNKEYAEQFNIEEDLLIKAEPLKHVHGGFYEEDLLKLLDKAGFRDSEIVYEWFLGEASVIHGNYPEGTDGILKDYFSKIMPLSRHLFKYLIIMASK